MVLMGQKSPRWKVLLPGESPRLAPRRARGRGQGDMCPGVVPRLTGTEDRDAGGRGLSCDSLSAACSHCRGTLVHVWSMNTAQEPLSK